MKPGEVASCTLMVVGIVVVTPLALLLHSFLSSLPFNKRNVFTFLDHAFLRLSVLRVYAGVGHTKVRVEKK